MIHSKHNPPHEGKENHFFFCFLPSFLIIQVYNSQSHLYDIILIETALIPVQLFPSYTRISEINLKSLFTLQHNYNRGSNSIYIMKVAVRLHFQLLSKSEILMFLIGLIVKPWRRTSEGLESILSKIYFTKDMIVSKKFLFRL